MVGRRHLLERLATQRPCRKSIMTLLPLQELCRDEATLKKYKSVDRHKASLAPSGWSKALTE